MRRLGLALTIALLSGSSLAAANSRSEARNDAKFEAMLKRIDPADRLEQICDYAAADRIGRDKNPYHPDRAVIDRFLNPRSSATRCRATAAPFAAAASGTSSRLPARQRPIG